MRARGPLPGTLDGGDRGLEQFTRLAEACNDPAACLEVSKQALSALCPDLSKCGSASGKGRKADYSWIELLLQRGVSDGRRRLILYIISRYLVNVKGLEEGEAVKEIVEFLDRSCKNYGNCSKVYESWIRNVVSKVKAGGWKPWTLERLKEKDPQLFAIVSDLASKGAKG